MVQGMIKGDETREEILQNCFSNVFKSQLYESSHYWMQPNVLYIVVLPVSTLYTPPPPWPLLGRRETHAVFVFIFITAHFHMEKESEEWYSLHKSYLHFPASPDKACRTAAHQCKAENTELHKEITWFSIIHFYMIFSEHDLHPQYRKGPKYWETIVDIFKFSLHWALYQSLSQGHISHSASRGRCEQTRDKKDRFNNSNSDYLYTKSLTVITFKWVKWYIIGQPFLN